MWKFGNAVILNNIYYIIYYIHFWHIHLKYYSNKEVVLMFGLYS